jgi:hypothetical protein
VYASLVAPIGARHDAANRVTPGCRMLARWRMVDVVIEFDSKVRVEVVAEKQKSHLRWTTRRSCCIEKVVVQPAKDGKRR